MFRLNYMGWWLIKWGVGNVLHVVEKVITV